MLSVHFIVLAFLLVSNVQGTPLQEDDDVLENMKQWVREKLLGAIDDLKKAEQELKDTVKQALDDSRVELEQEYANSYLEYHTHRENLHPVCFEQGLSKLTKQHPQIDLPSTTSLFALDSFAGDTPTPAPPNCVMEAVKDVGLMLYKVAKYIASILNTLDDILNGFNLCADTWWKKFTCIFTYIGTATSDLYHTIKDVVVLIKDLQSLGVDIKEAIANCTHPKKLEIRQQMLFALDHAKSCSQMYKDQPNNFL